jgi:hypothetical protein
MAPPAFPPRAEHEALLYSIVILTAERTFFFSAIDCPARDEFAACSPEPDDDTHPGSRF